MKKKISEDRNKIVERRIYIEREGKKERGKMRCV